MLKLGSAEITKVVDFDPFEIALDFILPNARIEELVQHQALLAPHHVDFGKKTILLGMHSFLMRVAGLTILIDGCVGEHKHRPRRLDWHERSGTGYVERLAARGVAPEDVDVVMCTHLHADHVGWNTRLVDGRWVPTFPNARYLIGRKEFAHWQSVEAAEPGVHNHGSYADSVLPVMEAGKAELVDDGFSLAGGMTIVPLAGHSPGQIGLELAGAGHAPALFCGDAFHSPVQVLRPEWSSAFCADPGQAADLRRNLAERSAQEGLLLLPAHLRSATAMRAERHTQGYRPVFV